VGGVTVPAGPNLSLPGLDLPGVKFGPTSLELEEDLTLAEFERLLGFVEHLDNSSPWWVGDALLWGEERYGDRVFQLIEGAGWALHTRQTRLRVSMRVAENVRMADLSWSHHREVALLDDPNDQRRWLELALSDGWSARELGSRMDAEPDGGGVGARSSAPAPPETVYDWALKYRKAATTLVGVLRGGYRATAEELAQDIESSLA
jgi:hypothetical protein